MSNEQSELRTCLALLRVKQWTKNLIAYAPLLFAMKVHEWPRLVAASECVVAFCLVSSAVYIVNDVVDCEADKRHPKKSQRPIAAGQVSVSKALLIAAVLAPLGLALSFYVRPTLMLILLVYVLLTLSYSLWLKRYPIVDVFSIAAGFVLRAVAGAVAIKVPSSGWFLLCTSLGALFLACEKRRQELKLLESEAKEHRRALNSYSAELVDRMEAVILPSLLTGYIFYSFQSIHGEWMMLTVPFVLFGLLRYQMLSLSKAGSLAGSPEDVLIKDRPIQVTICLWLLTAAAVVYGCVDKYAQLCVQYMDNFWR